VSQFDVAVVAPRLLRHAKYRDPLSPYIDSLKQGADENLSSLPLHKPPALSACHSLASLGFLTFN